MIIITDYGLGNLRSREHAAARAGIEAMISRDPAASRAASNLILPGVVTFASAWSRAGAREAHRQRDYASFFLQILIEERVELWAQKPARRRAISRH